MGISEDVTEVLFQLTSPPLSLMIRVVLSVIFMFHGSSCDIDIVGFCMVRFALIFSAFMERKFSMLEKVASSISP